MRSTAMDEREKARREFEAYLMGDRCYCGGYKWAGFLFCFPCQGKLTPCERRGIYGKSGEALLAVYHKVRARLQAGTGGGAL